MELIERDSFLSLLNAGFKKLATGEGHCFFIMGEPGIGKTAVVKKFLAGVENESIQYAGACDSLFTPRPLAPLYDLALQIKEEWAENIHSISSKAELFTQFVKSLAEKEIPVVLVFEDIHWADEATLDFIKFLARRISQLKCLLILTCRDDEVSQQHALRKVLGDLSPGTYSRIQLQPLSIEAVQKLSNEKGYDAKEVYAITGGNPFYLNEILASYSPGVPDNIKDSILAVYDRLEPGTKNVWEMFSVIPEGLEIKRFTTIKSAWSEGLDHCFTLGVIIVKNNKVIFKHELYRRTIEQSLPPFKRIDLNKKILDHLLPSFEEEEEIERIVHYAKNANENNLVMKYAPLAAKQAISVGAHIQASKLYLTAIEYFQGYDLDQLVRLYEAYAYECYLINQVKEAIIYQEKALKIWQEKNDIEQSGNSLRFLSRLWWFDGNREEAEKYAQLAVEMLAGSAASKAKAMAYSNMAQLKMISDETESCIDWGSKAIEMAREIGDEETLSHALNNVGTAQWRSGSDTESGKELLKQSLGIALKNSFHEHAARAYSNLIFNGIETKQYDLARQYLGEGINYCEERNLDSSKNYKLLLKARLRLETGDWNTAASIAEDLLSLPNQVGTVRIGAFIVSATIKLRRGQEDALAQLEEAKAIVFAMKERQRLIPFLTSCLEYEWLTGKEFVTETELKECIHLVQTGGLVFQNSEFAYWLEKARAQAPDLPSLYEPYQLLKTGQTAKAAGYWEQTGCPFEKALALSAGDEEDRRNALAILQQLGAVAVYEKVKMEMRSSGIKKIPRGLRESTKTNPANLTNRELDVLRLLQKAVQNKEIAGTLFISPKTVDHHISNILFKLDVNSRAKAVSEAIRLGILK